MKCQWCGRDIFYGDYYYNINGRGIFCSEKCRDEWKWEKGGGKDEAEYKESQAKWRQEAEAYRRQLAEANSKRAAERAAEQEADREHFRPFIEERIGHPLKLDEIWWNDRTKTWAAKEEMQAEMGAGMKRLEQESGIMISAIPGVMSYAGEMDYSGVYWFPSHNRWGFKVPARMAICERFGDTYHDSGWYDRVYWVTPESLAPYLSVAEYEGRKIQDLDYNSIPSGGPEYTLLPDRSYVISYKEVSDVLTRKRKWKRSGIEYTKFSSSENKFIRKENIWKDASLLKKGHSVTNLIEVSLNELKILIPVKKIQVQAVPAAPKPAQPAKAAPARPAKAASAAAPRFCGECGTRFEPGEKFCGNCGAKI
jgi:hypothetical protein